MLQLRALDTLGGGNRDWLKARHHFAVDSQGNPAHARLGNFRGNALNIPWLQPDTAISSPRVEESW